MLVYVRFGSLADICIAKGHVRFAPNSDRESGFPADQWERLTIGLQEIYLAGAIDSLSTITVPPAAATAKHYNDCLVKKQITAHIIAEEMKAIIQTRPELRPKPATGALLASLIKLCGLPVPDWPSPSK